MSELAEYKEAVIFFGVVATAAFSLLWCYLPAIRLVWRCLSLEEPFPLWNTLQAFGDSLWPFKPAIFRKQMRLWLELRILHPKPRQEPGWYFEKTTKRYQLEFDDVAHRRSLAVWSRNVRGKFGALKLKGTEPVIDVNDVFRLNDDATKNKIKQYLLAVSDLGLSLDEEASFLCDVKVNEGFLLPLNLLAGLMSRFAADWDPIISSYGAMAARSFSPQQISVFNLWLLWGPSVPICGCDQWSGPITLQYGFGDENNSVRVRVRDQTKENLLSAFNKSVQARNNTAHPALHASITGKLWPPSSFVQGDICGAQTELLNPDREAFILEYKSHTVIGNPAGSNLFYTAYVWAMFVVGREVKPSLSDVRTAPWLHVMPFFEHANIVNESTYKMAKLQLAHKVLTFVKQSQQFESDPNNPPLRLWYVSALDESGCGHILEVEQKGKSIRAMMNELLRESEFKQIRHRVITDDPTYNETLSGCELSAAISELFDKMEADRTSPKSKSEDTGRGTA